MKYQEIFKTLKNIDIAQNGSIDVPELGVELISRSFSSDHHHMLPGKEEYDCHRHDMRFSEAKVANHSSGKSVELLDRPDFEVESNHKVAYTVVKKSASSQPAGEAIIILHGLNEKKWDKYLPWAYELIRLTGRPVVLFPIAFHMDRAPEKWSDKHLMHRVSEVRKKRYRGNTESSFVNAAISSRLEDNPERLFWSGLQTYSDILGFIERVRGGMVPELKKEADLDFFGYSIGAFLSLILLMGNPKNELSKSRVFAFCGGMTLDRMYPVSRYIMDSRSVFTMNQYFAEVISNDFVESDFLGHFQGNLHPEESWFKKMLLYNQFQRDREERLSELSDRVMALVLTEDKVAPPVEALNTLQGGFRSIDIPVVVKDFNYPYTHVSPFSVFTKYEAEVDQAFKYSMKLAADFFMKSRG